jgi:16S rRNA (guanine527-N7)-methyltransferase
MATLVRAVLAKAGQDARSRADERVLAGLAKHDELVERWNPVHNLTRLRGEAAARMHYVDALCGCLALESSVGVPGSLVDVGSGLGLPGLMAALLWPSSEVTLLDSARKRVSFLQRAIREMGLENVSAVHGRAGPGAGAWNVAISRATFPWEKLEPLASVVESGGTVCAFVSEAPPHDEWAEACSRWRGSEPRVVSYDAPGLENRALLIATMIGNSV